MEPYSTLLILIPPGIGVLFLVSGLVKVVRFPHFYHILHSYELLPKQALPFVGLMIVLLEVAVGVGIMTNVARREMTHVALALLVVFTFALIYVMVRRISIPTCGCLLIGRPSPVSGTDIVKNIVLSGILLVSLEPSWIWFALLGSSVLSVGTLVLPKLDTVVRRRRLTLENAHH